MKAQKGITLIALTITIIVMLILVGVTVNVALNGGLFTTSKDAVKKQEEQQILETIVGATKYGTGEWKWIEGNEKVEGYSYETGEIELLQTYDAIVNSYGQDNITEIYRKNIKKLAPEIEAEETLQEYTYEEIVSYFKMLIEAGAEGEIHNSNKVTEIEFSVKGEHGEYVYIMTINKIVPKSIYTAQEQEKKDLYNLMSEYIVLGIGEKDYTPGSTTYYVYKNNEIDVVRTYNKIEEELKKEGKQVVLVYKEFKDGTSEETYATRKLIKVVFDVVGENGSYAYSISTNNPADNPILEIEGMDIKASKTYDEEMDKVRISVMQEKDSSKILVTQEDVYKYIGQVYGKFGITDIKEVIECAFDKYKEDSMSYDEIE